MSQLLLSLRYSLQLRLMLGTFIKKRERIGLSCKLVPVKYHLRKCNIPLCMSFFPAPGWPPENVFATNKTTPTMIPVSWKPIRDPYYVHGVLLGYTVTYRAMRNPNKELEEKEKSVKVGPKTTYIELQNLSSFTIYSIKVQAFTRKGNGTSSAVIFAGKVILL